VDRSTVSRWATRFREGLVTRKDYQKPGRPKTSTDERSVKLVADLLPQDRRATCEEIHVSQATWFSPSVFLILTKGLEMRKICARWIPRCLTAEQKQKRLEIATSLKQRFKLKVKHSCIEMSLLTKRGLETLNRS